MYEAEISRANPALILFLVDHSGSMQDTWQNQQRKSDGLATIINRSLYELTLRCAKSEGVRDYFYVGVLGYGAQIAPALTGSLSGRDVVPISDIASFPARVEDRAKKEPDGVGGIIDTVVKFPVWLDPVANGGTPMCGALDRAGGILDNWVAAHPNSFPPIVINLTDGEATDGDITDHTDRIRAVLTTDGHALLFNIHLSAVGTTPIIFPSEDSGLPDDHARLLFRTASELTPEMRASVQSSQQVDIREGARGFVFNGDMVAVTGALELGTQPSNLR